MSQQAVTVFIEPDFFSVISNQWHWFVQWINLINQSLLLMFFVEIIQYNDDDLKSFPIINSFDQFEFIEFAFACC
mgnify:CR=1 FL=1